MPDQESIRGQLTLLDIVRQRLRHELKQREMMGIHTPSYIQADIEKAQAQVKEIKAYLLHNGVNVEDLPEDSQQEAQTQTPSKKDTKLQTDTADFVIITALEEERDAVLDKLPDPERHAPSGDIRIYYTANLSTKNETYRIAVVSLIGMGRLEAANATNDAIKRWKPKYIIMVGIAGGIASAQVKVGDVIISNQVADYELQKFTADGTEIRWSAYQVNQLILSAVNNFRSAEWIPHISALRPVPGTPKRHIGTIASGDKVIATNDVLTSYQKTWPKLIGVEMEASGVAKAAFQTQPPPGFFMVRGVSDLADADKGDDWREYACDVAATYTLELLKSGLVPLL